MFLRHCQLFSINTGWKFVLFVYLVLGRELQEGSS